MACGPTPATSNATRLFYLVQDTCGELPVSPVFKQIPFTTGVPAIQRDVLQSAELDGSPEITGVRLGSYNVTNETGVELKYGVHDDLLASAMQSDWVSGNTVASGAIVVDATAKTITATGVDVTSDISVGDLIKLPDLTGYNAEPQLVTAISFSTDTVITVGAAKVANALLGIVGLEDESGTSTITTNDILTVGTTRKKVALLVEYGDISGGPTYDLVMDAEATGFNFNVAVNALVTGTINFIGKTFAGNSGLPSGATLEDAAAAEPYTGIDGCLAKDGAPLLLSTSADMTLDRGASPVFELCSKYLSHISYAKANNTVSVSTFFYDYNLSDQFESEVDGDYTIICSLDGKAMAFNYPTAKITGLSRDVAEGDIAQTAELQAYKPSGAVSSLILRRVE